MSKDLNAELDKINNLKEMYDSLLASHQEVYYAKEDSKEAETKLRESIAMEKGLYKKDGSTPDIAAVKMNSLNGAIHLWDGGEDKLGAIADLQDEYLQDIKKGTIDKKVIEGLGMKRVSVKEANAGMKDTKEELKVQANPTIIEAIDMLAKEEVRILKENEDAEKGIEIKQKKDTSDTFAILNEIKKKLGLI